jgi:hypothetical protein
VRAGENSPGEATPAQKISKIKKSTIKRYSYTEPSLQGTLSFVVSKERVDGYTGTKVP